MIYLAAFLLLEGTSMMSIADQLPPRVVGFREDGTFVNTDPAHYLYNDLPLEEQEHWISQLKPQSSALLGTQTSTSYLHIPCTYLHCEGDTAMLPGAQRFMVAQAIAAGASVQTVSCSAGHSPFLSQHELVVDVICKVAQGCSMR